MERNIFAIFVPMILMAAVAVSLLHRDRAESELEAELTCSCAGKPLGCETMSFARTGSPEGPRAHCAVWSGGEGRREMSCCVVPKEDKDEDQKEKDRVGPHQLAEAG